MPLKFGHGDEVEKYLWKLPMMAIQSMTPEFPFRRVDVMITAKRLEGFWRYCQGARSPELVANATVIHNTLFIDAFEPVGLETGPELDRMSLFAICGSSWPWNYLDSFLHHRVLCYTFGSLNIVVVGSVDCSVDGEAAGVHVFEPVLPQGHLMGWRAFPQTWFRRRPIVIAARKNRDLVRSEYCEDLSIFWRRWERFENNQRPLQMMVSVFQKIKDILQRRAPGEPCIVKSGPGYMLHGKPQGARGTNDETTAPINSSLQGQSIVTERPLHSLEVWQAKHGRYPLPPEWAKKFQPLSRLDEALENRQTLNRT